MKAKTSTRSILVATVLAAALVFSVVAVGCFGGGDDSGDGVTTSMSSAEVMTTASVGTTVVANVDELSSFRSKDPFIPQAQVTTTLAPSTTTPTTIVTTTTPTTIVTTTAPHRLTVTRLQGDGVVSFTLDSIAFNGVAPGSALYTGPWGSIQVVSVKDDAPFAATFLRNGTAYFELELGEYRTW